MAWNSAGAGEGWPVANQGRAAAPVSPGTTLFLEDRHKSDGIDKQQDAHSKLEGTAKTFDCGGGEGISAASQRNGIDWRGICDRDGNRPEGTPRCVWCNLVIVICSAGVLGRLTSR